MKQNDMILSLNGDTFATLKKDFDTILARTMGNMTMKGAFDAVITLKLSVSLEKGSVNTDAGFKDITKPSFKHDISSVMQVKDKVTGQFKGEYGMVWDEDNGWVLRKIDNGQMSLFDDDVVDAQYVEVSALPEPEDEEKAEDNVHTPFGRMCKFVGEEFHIALSDDNKYTVRDAEDRVILSSATSEDSPFYCDGEVLDPHLGHKLVCGADEVDESISKVFIKCDDCDEMLFEIKSPAFVKVEGEAFEQAAELFDDFEEEEDEDYDYEDPEDEE